MMFTIKSHIKAKLPVTNSSLSQINILTDATTTSTFSRSMSSKHIHCSAGRGHVAGPVADAAASRAVAGAAACPESVRRLRSRPPSHRRERVAGSESDCRRSPHNVQIRNTLTVPRIFCPHRMQSSIVVLHFSQLTRWRHGRKRV